jgi:hypothetical protein
METHFHVMSHVARMANPVDTMSIPFAPMELFAMGSFAWSLIGLWLWLLFDEGGGGSGSFFGLMFTFFCGPSAWVLARWKATHRPPPRRPRMKAEQSIWPHNNWRN